MFELIKYGNMLLSLVRDKLVPFLTVPPEGITIYSPAVFVLNKIPVIGGILEDLWGTGALYTLPWPFGDFSVAEVLFGGGLIFILGFRLVKFFTDIVL